MQTLAATPGDIVLEKELRPTLFVKVTVGKEHVHAGLR